MSERAKQIVRRLDEHSDRWHPASVDPADFEQDLVLIVTRLLVSKWTVAAKGPTGTVYLDVEMSGHSWVDWDKVAVPFVPDEWFESDGKAKRTIDVRAEMVSVRRVLYEMTVLNVIEKRFEPCDAPTIIPVRADVRANKSVVFSGDEPPADIKDLAFKLADRGTRSMNAVAREFSASNWKSLLADLRRRRKERTILLPEDQ